MTSITLTREELHRLVWDMPMYRLADQYGITGNGLAKICDRLGIPYPPRGYWARKAAGKAVITAPLPPKGTPDEARITPTPKKEATLPDPGVAEEAVRLQKVVEASAGRRGVRRHPIIRAWAEERQEQIRAWRRDRPLYGTPPQPFTKTDLRKHQFLGALFQVLERAGGKVTDKLAGNIECVVAGEPVVFQVREKSRQVRLPPPAGHKGGDSYYPRTELRPTGRLIFVIKTWLPGGMRSEWVESDRRSLTDLLPEFAATLISAAPLLVEERLRREERERIQREEEQRRREERERQRMDRNRWRRFLEHARLHREAEMAREFLKALEHRPVEEPATVGGRSLEEWIGWVKHWIEVHDAAGRGPEAVFEDISNVTSWTYRDD